MGFIRIIARTSHDADDTELMELIVQDNGCGMPERKLEQLRINLANQRLPVETGEEVSGGFGLHNVQQRIRLYYGQQYGVQVDSSEGIGTTVTMRIPMRGRD
ncbi:Histidine kinase-, DNA gyrase B-, and HSP90-like ATPase [compost metagenome]